MHGIEHDACELTRLPRLQRGTTTVRVSPLEIVTIGNSVHGGQMRDTATAQMGEHHLGGMTTELLVGMDDENLKKQ